MRPKAFHPRRRLGRRAHVYLWGTNGRWRELLTGKLYEQIAKKQLGKCAHWLATGITKPSVLYGAIAASLFNNPSLVVQTVAL